MIRLNKLLNIMFVEKIYIVTDKDEKVFDGLSDIALCNLPNKILRKKVRLVSFVKMPNYNENYTLIKIIS